ncbi:MAG: hypothetical protein QNJ38_19555, partial [Prochloraceae cyanobacterium]|nr:hypothetical protein [Prochloraceae cyanobacterium]
MHPLVKEISEQIIKEHWQDFDKIRSGKLVNYLKVEDKQFLVGKLAGKFASIDRYLNIKEDLTIYRVLAAIGAALRENNVKSELSIPILVSVLIPWRKYRDRAILKKRLAKLLSSYEFCKATIKIGATSKSILVRPFGGGLALAYLLKQGKEFFKGKKIGIAVFRNDAIAGLVFDNGVVSFGETQNLGLNYFLDLVIEKDNQIDRQNLLEAINLAIKEIEIDKYTNRENLISDGTFNLGKCSFPNWEKLEAIEDLATSCYEINKTKKIKYIAHILERASHKYRAEVRKWLKKTFPIAEFEYLIISGESVNFLQQEIEEYCRCYRPINFEEPILFLDEGCYKYRYKQHSLFDTYYSLPDENYLKLISDRELAIVISQALSMKETNREELARHNLSIDNLGLFQYLLVQEKQYQTQKRSASRISPSVSAQLKTSAKKASTKQGTTKAIPVELGRLSQLDSENIFIESKTAKLGDRLSKTIVKPNKSIEEKDYLIDNPVEAKKAQISDRLPKTEVQSQATELYHSPKTFVEPQTASVERGNYSPDTFVEPQTASVERGNYSPDTFV